MLLTTIGVLMSNRPADQQRNSIDLSVDILEIRLGSRVVEPTFALDAFTPMVTSDIEEARISAVLTSEAL